MKTVNRLPRPKALASAALTTVLAFVLLYGCSLLPNRADDGEQGGSELTDEERAAMEAQAAEDAQVQPNEGESGDQSAENGDGGDDAGEEEAEQGAPGLDGEDALVAGSIPLEDRFRDPDSIADLQARLGLIPPAPPMVEHLLYRADMRAVLNYQDEIRSAPLPGREITSFWNARRLAAGDGLGCTVQRWVYPSGSALREAHEAYVDSLVTPRNINDLAEDAWLATFASVRSVTFMHRLSTSMVQIACEEELATESQIQELAERVYARL